LKTNKSLSISWVVVILVINGCNPLSSFESIQNTIFPSPHQTAITILQSSVTPTLLSPTQKPIIQPSITEVPVLPVEEAEAKVLELLKSNGGCQLPCFWGLTPGQTKREEAVSFLYQFMNISPGPGVEITIPRDDLQLGTNVYLANAANQTGILQEIEVITTAYHRIPQDSGYVYINNFDNPYYHEYFQYYTLSYLLKNYGKPDDIYFDIETDFVKEFHIYLDYSRLGWGAKLLMPLSISKDVVKGCPAKAFTTLWLWTPGDTRTAKKYGFSSNTLFKSIKEIPDITLEEFYNKYKVPTNDKCVEIPLSVWP
jgi:hypothetical protein